MTTNLPSHPSDTELDALRAGIYDDAPGARAALTAHLETCEACRGRAAVWRTAKEALTREPVAVQHLLRNRRAAALAGESSGAAPRPSRWRLPMALAAGVAALAIGIGVALQSPQNSGVNVAEAPIGDVPDLYTDIDFYLWLLRKQHDESGSSG